MARVTLPYAKLPPMPAVPANNFVDEKLAAKWTDLGLVPSPLCSDDEFLRRLDLDAIGTLPTPAEVKAFLADRDPKKRQKAIDRVLERPEFVDWWALKWGDLRGSTAPPCKRRGCGASTTGCGPGSATTSRSTPSSATW